MYLTSLSRAIVMTSLFALAACGGGGFGNQSGQASGKVAAPATKEESAKLDAYTEAYNGLVDTFGLPATTEQYAKADIAHRSPSDSIFISNGWVETGEAKLKEARAKPGDLGKLDATAAALDEALLKVLARLKPLYNYYNSKAYREDGLAKGKSEDAPMRAEFEAANKALDAFNAELQVQRSAATERELATLKQQGNMPAYTTKLAMERSKDLIDLFTKPADLKDPAILAKADAIAKSLDTLLADQQKAVAEAKAKATEPLETSRLSTYASAGDQLGTVLGDYRQMKQSHSVEDMKSTVTAYNQAVMFANMIH